MSTELSLIINSIFKYMHGFNLILISGQRQTDKQRQFEIFFLDTDLVPGGKYFIEMSFTGPLKGDLAGLYLSKYNRGNETK